MPRPSKRLIRSRSAVLLGKQRRIDASAAPSSIDDAATSAAQAPLAGPLVSSLASEPPLPVNLPTPAQQGVQLAAPFPCPPPPTLEFSAIPSAFAIAQYTALVAAQPVSPFVHWEVACPPNKTYDDDDSPESEVERLSLSDGDDGADLISEDDLTEYANSLITPTGPSGELEMVLPNQPALMEALRQIQARAGKPPSKVRYRVPFYSGDSKRTAFRQAAKTRDGVTAHARSPTMDAYHHKRLSFAQVAKAVKKFSSHRRIGVDGF